ncbi:hypothetical protein BSPWISOXPB_1945, partial [uncultured Gammaproteobacteria bacterium]
YATRAQARSAIFEYIEVFYNKIRRHSTIDYCSPSDYEKKFYQDNIPNLIIKPLGLKLGLGINSKLGLIPNPEKDY